MTVLVARFGVCVDGWINDCINDCVDGCVEDWLMTIDGCVDGY
jgi:hypothetical protein